MGLYRIISYYHIYWYAPKHEAYSFRGPGPCQAQRLPCPSLPTPWQPWPWRGPAQGLPTEGICFKYGCTCICFCSSYVCIFLGKEFMSEVGGVSLPLGRPLCNWEIVSFVCLCVHGCSGMLCWNLVKTVISTLSPFPRSLGGLPFSLVWCIRFPLWDIWNQVKSNKIKWNQTRSNGIKLNPMKYSKIEEIKWNQVNSMTIEWNQMK